MNFLSCSLISDFFELEVTQSEKTVDLVMHFPNPTYYNTKNLSQTIPLLSKHLPQIFYHKCMNDKQLSFLTEVKNTEVAHLFEHILLEYLIQFRALSNREVTYTGETTWNWLTEPQGIFHININTTPEDTNVFLRSLGQGLLLLQEIFHDSTSSYDSELLHVGLDL